MSFFGISESYFIVLFYIFVLAFFYIKRKNVQVQLKFIFLYKTKLGLKLMDKIARSHTEHVKLFGYIGIGAGFIGMAVMVFFLFQGVYNLFFVPDAPPTISPVIPGVQVPGGIFVPFIHGILSIFIVAAVHEFSHGVVARAHNIPIKSSGMAMFGPIFGAFVEPDERLMQKQNDVVQYSVFAAGSFSNMILSVIAGVLLVAIFIPLMLMAYPHDGVSFTSLTDNYPAIESGVEVDTVYNTVNGVEIKTTQEFIDQLNLLRPDEYITMTGPQGSVSFLTTTHPDDESRPFIGVEGIYQRFKGDQSFGFSVVEWFRELLVWVFVLSIGIGLANMMPIGPIDGGRMFLLAMKKTRGNQKGSKTWSKISLLLLIIILLLLSPVILKTFQGFF